MSTRVCLPVSLCTHQPTNQVALPDGARDATGRTGVLVTGWSKSHQQEQDEEKARGDGASDAAAAACLLLPNPAAESTMLQPNRPFFFHLVNTNDKHGDTIWM